MAEQLFDIGVQHPVTDMSIKDLATLVPDPGGTALQVLRSARVLKYQSCLIEGCLAGRNHEFK
jgi:hypothetical protein